MNRLFILKLLSVLFCILLQACGGGGGGGGNTSLPDISVTGVAATGAAIAGSVTLKDANGATRTANISQPGGSFKIDVAGLAPPFFLKAGDSAGTLTLYSVATGPGNFNINPISNLVVVSAAMNIDPLAKTPDVVFGNPANFATLTPAQVQAATARVMAQMSPAFKAALAANGSSNVNPLTDTFQIGNGLDRVFDNFSISLVDSTLEVRQLQVANSATTVLGLVDMLGTFPAPGIYDGTVVRQLSAGGGGQTVRDILIIPSGEMRYVTDNGVVVIARLTATGNSVAGSGKAYAPSQDSTYRFADGSRAVDLTIDGQLGAGTFTGTNTYGNFHDAFNFVLNPAQTGIAPSLGKIAGTYASTTASNVVFIGHIEANGAIWGSGPGTGYSGRISPIGPDINAYRVTLAYLVNGTYGYVSGLATYHENSLGIDVLPMPAAIVPPGYAGDLATLGYTQTLSGSHGKLRLLLSSPLQQIVLDGVQMTSQLQTIATRPAADSLMIQVIGTRFHSATAAGNIQYGESGTSIEVFPQGTGITAGSLSIVPSPGSIELRGPSQIAVPIPAGQAQALAALSAGASPAPTGALQPGQAINWQTFTIGAGESVTFSQSSASSANLNAVSVTSGAVTWIMTSSGSTYVFSGTTMTVAGTSGTGTAATILAANTVSTLSANSGVAITANTGTTLAPTTMNTITATTGNNVLTGNIINGGSASLMLVATAAGSGSGSLATGTVLSSNGGTIAITGSTAAGTSTAGMTGVSVGPSSNSNGLGMTGTSVGSASNINILLTGLSGGH